MNNTHQVNGIPKERREVLFYVKSDIHDGSFSTQYLSDDLSQIIRIEAETFEKLLTELDEILYKKIPENVKLKVIYEVDLDR